MPSVPTNIQQMTLPFILTPHIFHHASQQIYPRLSQQMNPVWNRPWNQRYTHKPPVSKSDNAKPTIDCACFSEQNFTELFHKTSQSNDDSVSIDSNDDFTVYGVNIHISLNIVSKVIDIISEIMHNSVMESTSNHLIF